jgi:hypothetical protein
MQITELVHHLKAVLPKYTDDFSDRVNITNIVVNGNNVTITTDANHHLEDNNTFLISNVKNYINIVSLKRYNNIAIALCSNHHNIELNQVEINGSSDSLYNGIKTISNIKNLEFNVSSFSIDNVNNIATINTVESTPFIVNQNYLITINNKEVPIKNIINSQSFTVDNLFGLASDTELKKIYLSKSKYLFFFDVSVNANANPTGNPILLETRNYGYNGYKMVISHTHNTITFVENQLYGLPYILNNFAGYVKSNIRIVGVDDYQRAKNIFSRATDARDQSKSWLFVYRLSRIVAKDSNGKTDVNIRNVIGSNLLAEIIQGLELCVMINLGELTNEFTICSSKDKVSNYIDPLYRSIAGYIPASPFGNNVFYHKLTPTSDDQKESDNSFYSHYFTFETFLTITNKQEINIYDINALNNISFNLKDASNKNNIGTISFP